MSSFLASSDQYVAVVPSDTIPLSFNGAVQSCKGILVGTAGNVVVIGASNTAVTFYLSAGSVHPISAKIIKATGTAATNIVAIF